MNKWANKKPMKDSMNKRRKCSITWGIGLGRICNIHKLRGKSPKLFLREDLLLILIHKHSQQKFTESPLKTNYKKTSQGIIRARVVSGFSPVPRYRVLLSDPKIRRRHPLPIVLWSPWSRFVLQSCSVISWIGSFSIFQQSHISS